MKKSLLFLSSCFFFLSSYLSRADFFYACEGVNLWFHTILPSLLPFLILTSLLLETGAARRISARAEVFFKRFSVFPRLGFMHFFSVFSAVFPWERASLPSSMRQKKLTGTKRAIF